MSQSPWVASGRKIVFLGPSLGLSEARQICRDAEFHPPVRFGDLYALSCDAPGQLLIIDGVFHDATPVWQREILELLRSGWQVLGASSMGALRALELEPYGMIGVGTVFEWYRSGRIEGDDEVALIHGVAEMDYQPLTLPLVDVRYALMELQAEGVLLPPHVSGVLSAFKRMGHETRTRNALLTLVRAHGGDVEEVRDRVSDSCRSLKAQDARLALHVLAGHLPLPATMKPWPDPPSTPIQPQSVLQRRLYPLARPAIRVADAVSLMAQRPAGRLARLESDSRRHWFLCDWMNITGNGPDENERDAFAMQHADRLARELGVSVPRWCAASALQENELPEWMAGLAVEAWLTRRSASEIEIDPSPHRDTASRIRLALVDWMRRHGVEAPAECRADAGQMASWLVRMGPAHFGALDHDVEIAFVRCLAVSGELARWGRSAPSCAGSEESH